jgi:hypothetical protein
MARGPALKPLRTSRLRRSRNGPSVEDLVARIAALVVERQELRATGSPDPAIESNRVQLVRAQWELAYALIDEHLAEAPARTAA